MPYMEHMGMAVWLLLILFLIRLALTKTHPKEAILEKCSPEDPKYANTANIR